MGSSDDAGSAIGSAAARLAWDYADALAKAGGNKDLAPLYLPHGWTTLAGHLAQLLVIEALRQAEAAATANQGRAELRELCVFCGSPHFAVFYDPAAQGSHVECSRCGKVRLV